MARDDDRTTRIRKACGPLIIPSLQQREDEAGCVRIAGPERVAHWNGEAGGICARQGAVGAPSVDGRPLTTVLADQYVRPPRRQRLERRGDIPLDIRVA